MGSLKYIKLASPLRHIASSRVFITCGGAMELANIIRPLAGQFPHHIKNTFQFVEYIRKVKLEPGEVMTSYDVKALFTSVPVDPSIAIVQCILQQEPLLSQRTSMSIPQIFTLLEFCLKTHTSSSRECIMNRSMVQSWVPP